MGAPSTLIAVIGETATDVIKGVTRESANVAMEAVGDMPMGVVAQADHLRMVWARARKHTLVYTLVDGDPLAPVVGEWVRWLLERENQLDLAITAIVTTEMPDYYLVDQQLKQPDVDWYLANLRGLAPSRVVPVEMRPGPLAAALGNLSYGRPFPPGTEVSATARQFVPLPELVATEQMFD